MFKRFPAIVKELLLIIGIYGLLAEVIVIIVTQDKIFYSVGLIIGIFLAFFMCVHMHISIEDAIDFGEAGAQKHISKTYGFRTLVVKKKLGSRGNRKTKK
ncbi:hypothetical protein CG709_20950, partial [Lachnotalea glycerini]